MDYARQFRYWSAISSGAILLVALNGCVVSGPTPTSYDADTDADNRPAADRQMAADRPDVEPSAWYAINLRVANNALKNKNYSAAIRIYRKLHDAMPDRAEPLRGLGDALIGRKTYGAAANAFRAALARRSNDQKARRGLGKALLSDGRIEDGISQLEAALATSKDAGLFNRIGVSYELSGAAKTAQAYFRSGLAVHPDDIALRNNLALSLALAGHYFEAVEQFKKVLRHPAATRRHRMNLAFVHSMSGNFRAARLADAEIERVYDAAGPDKRMTRIQSLARAGNRAELLRMLNVAVPSVSTSASNFADAGTLPTEAGTLDRAPATAVIRSEEIPQQPTPKKPPVLVARNAVTDVANDAWESPNEAADTSNVSHETKLLTGGNKVINNELTRADSNTVAAASIQPGTEAGSPNSETPADEAQRVPIVPDEPANPTTVEQEENTLNIRKIGIISPFLPSKTALADPRRGAVDRNTQRQARSAPAARGYRVQIGAYRNKADAVRGRTIFTSMAPELTDKLETLIKSSKKRGSKATNYRLRTAPLASQAAADNLCGNLKSKGIDCLVIKHNDRLWSAA